MLLNSGQVKLLDFGVAKRIDAVDQGTPVGTLAYMSPEQWRGQDVDERCDIWAVGIVLFEILSGAHPLAPIAQNGYSSVADMDVPMPSLRDVCTDDGRLSEVTDRCLRKRKEERFGSADELLAAIAQAYSKKRISIRRRNHGHGYVGRAFRYELSTALAVDFGRYLVGAARLEPQTASSRCRVCHRSMTSSR